MRLGSLSERIARRDRHANLVVAEVTIQLLEFMPIRDRIEGTHPERAPLHRNRFDAVRVHDASFGSHEVETPLELAASGERQHTIQPAGRQLPQLIDGIRTPCVDHAMSAELSNQTCRRGAGCRCDHVRPALNGKLNRHRSDRTGRAKDQHGLSGPQFERVDSLECC